MKAFSAPGKALLAGGYLVLDRQFTSYVVALSARMHAVVEGDEISEGTATTITIKSPQFAQGQWVYAVDDDLQVTETTGMTNPFAEHTVRAVLAFLKPSIHANITITIFSDPAYHSTQDTQVKSTKDHTFHYHSKPITQVAKTGLGSSAGLVTVLTTALLFFYTPDLSIGEQLTTIHNLAQLAHCQAQGKVGSGFDVAAATFGSITYNRFEPSLITNLKPLSGSTAEEYHREVVQLVQETDWDIHMVPVALPRGITLLMGDIKGGSNTPKLVNKVLRWRETDPTSKDVYNAINNANITTIRSLSNLNKLAESSPEDYQALLIRAATVDSAEMGSLHRDLEALVGANRLSRENFQYITEHSGAEIEPPEQTLLLDRCLREPGVIAAVVPGAGGYDAISVLIVEDSLNAFYRATRADGLFQNVSWMDLQEEAEGVKQVSAEDYRDLLE